MLPNSGMRLLSPDNFILSLVQSLHCVGSNIGKMLI